MRPLSASGQEAQFIHLVRLAWDLRMLRMSSAVELPHTDDPVLLVGKRQTLLKVRALRHGGHWFFVWGRGEGKRVPAYDERAPEILRRAARQ